MRGINKTFCALAALLIALAAYCYAENETPNEKPKETPQDNTAMKAYEYKTRLINTLDQGKQPQRIMHQKDLGWMVLIPAGEFTMGTNTWKTQGGRDDEAPEHKVYLDSFYIDQYEVTNRQYTEFCRKTGNVLPQSLRDSKYNDADKPVVGVIFEQAQEYAKWAGKRLPTEAEWEKAARGTDGRVYPWGSEWNPKSCNNKDLKNNATAKVGSYPDDKSPYEVYDMAGNVSEWTADCYDAKYYANSPEKNPLCVIDESKIVKRGGNYYYDTAECRTTHREGFTRTFMRNELGFRCVLDFFLINSSPVKEKMDEQRKDKVDDMEKKLVILESEFTDIFKKDETLPDSLIPKEFKSEDTIPIQEKCYIFLYNLTDKKVSISIANEEGKVVVYKKEMEPNNGRWVFIKYSPNFYLYYKFLEGEQEVKKGGYFKAKKESQTNLIFDISLLYKKSASTKQNKAKPGSEQKSINVVYGKYKPSYKDIKIVNKTGQIIKVSFQNEDKFVTANEFLINPGEYCENPFLNANYHIIARYVLSSEEKFKSESFFISPSKEQKTIFLTNQKPTKKNYEIKGEFINGITIDISEFTPIDQSKF